MYCSSCGAKNQDDDIYCGQCGAKLANAIPKSENTEHREALPPPSMDSRDGYAGLRPPDDEMRLLTRVAYSIYDSDQKTTVGAALNITFFGLCVGMIANLLAIFDKMNKLTQSLRTSGETYLSNKIYDQMGGDYTMGLMWLCLLLAALVLLFIMVGKLKLRLKKINRKEKKYRNSMINRNTM